MHHEPYCVAPIKQIIASLAVRKLAGRKPASHQSHQRLADLTPASLKANSMSGHDQTTDGNSIDDPQQNDLQSSDPQPNGRQPGNASSPAVASLRLWPAWVIAMAQAVGLVVTVTPSIQNLARFLVMMAGPAVTALLFSVWMLFGSRLRWPEKVAISLAAIAAPVIAALISVPEDALRTALWIYGVPLAVFLNTLALTVWSTSAQRSVVAICLMSLGWGSFALVRNEGFDGDYYPEFAWRWSPRHEDTLTALTAAGPAAKLEFAEADEPGSWPQFRGPEGNGVVTDSPPQLDWVANPPRELWRISIGPGWSSFSYHNGRLFTQEQRGDQEYITCYSATDGSLVWSHADDTRFTEVVSGAGPRSTPSVADGFVYAFGGTGLLTCLNEADGSMVWQRDLAAELGAPIPMWGCSGSPLIVGSQLILFAGAPGDQGLISLDTTTGKSLWGFASTDMNYTTARLMTLSGEDCIVFCDSRGVHSLAPETGTVKWTFQPNKWKGPAMVDPQQLSPTSLLVGLGDGIGLARLEVGRTGEQWTISETWSTTKLRPSFNDSLVLDDYIYGFNQAIFSCIDATTGERQWHGGRYGFGQTVLLKSSRQIIAAAEDGDIALLQATPDGLDEMARIPVLDGKTWNHPIVVGDRLFVRNGKAAVCLQLTP